MTTAVAMTRACALLTVSAITLLATGAVAQQAAQPAPSQTELPEVVITSKAQSKAASKKNAASPPPVSASQTPSAAASTPPETRSQSGLPAGIAPVENYVADEATTATKSDTPLTETPQSISVIGAEQIRDQGARSVQEAVRYVPGVLADGFGLDSRGDYIIVRGVEGAYFLDGLRTPLGQYANRAALDPHALERVEVLRGPASMLYGQSSTGGIINGVSKRPQAEPNREITVEYGSHDYKQVRTDLTGPLTSDGKWLYRIVGVGRDAETQVDYVDNNRLFLAPSLTYNPTNDTSFTLMGTFQKDETGSTSQFLPHAGTLYPNVDGKRVPRSRFAGEPSDYFDTEAQTVSFFADHKFSDNLSIHHGTRYWHNENAYDSHYPAILTQGRIAFFNQALTGLALNQVFGDPLPPGFDPSSAVPFNIANSPFLDAGQTEMARARTLRFTTTEVVTSDTYLTGKFDTGPVSHKLTVGYDVMWYDTHGTSAGTLVTNLLREDILTPGFTNFFQPYAGVLGMFGLTPEMVGAGLGAGFGQQGAFNIYDPVYGQSGVMYDLENGRFTTEASLGTFGQNQLQNGIYIQDQIRFGPWIAVLGLRQDWLTIQSKGDKDVHEDALTGRAALMYAFDFGLTPYVSYSESFTPLPGTPVIDDFTDTTESAARPMEGEQIEIGFKYAPRNIPFLLSAAAYELKESNRLVQPDVIFDALQGAEIRVRGIEVEAAGQVSRNLKLIAAYSYTDAKYEKYHSLFSYNDGTPVEGVPKHQASLWGIYTFTDGDFKGLSFGAGVRYIGEATDVGQRLVAPTYATTELFEVKTPSYTLFDATVAYETADWRWQLSAQNLEDKYYVVSCTADRGDCGIGQGRTIITGFTYKF